MPEPDKEFQQRLLATFRIEAEEHVRAISGGLIDLENTPGVKKRAPIVERIFREAHSLKGAARAVNLGEIEMLCQSLEDVFAKAKRQEIGFNADALDVLHAVMDEIERLLHPEGSSSAKPGDLIRRLEALSIGPPGAEQPAQPGVEEAPVRSGAAWRRPPRAAPHA